MNLLPRHLKISMVVVAMSTSLSFCDLTEENRYGTNYRVGVYSIIATVMLCIPLQPASGSPSGSYFRIAFRKALAPRIARK